MSNDLSPAPAEPDLVALVGSRLCHDLISPLGAIGNGVELISMTGAADGPEIEMIAQSVAAANARIRFFRLAFGRATDQPVGRGEIVSLLSEYGRDGRTRHLWQPEGEQPRRLVKLALLAILCVEPALPRGGEIRVSAAAGHWTVRGDTRQTRNEPDLWAHLDGTGRDALSPAQVQFALLPREARAAGRSVVWTLDDSSAEIRF